MKNKDLIKILESIAKNAEKEKPFGDAVYGEYSVWVRVAYLPSLRKSCEQNNHRPSCK